MEPLQTWWATELYPSKDEDTFGVAGDFEVVRAADAQATIAALQERVQELEAIKIPDDAFTYCAYCGEKSPVDEHNEDLSAHIKVCPKHPMRDVESHLTQRTTELHETQNHLADADNEVEQLRKQLSERTAELEAIETILDIDSGKTTVDKVRDLHRAFKQVWESYQDASNEMFKAQAELERVRAERAEYLENLGLCKGNELAAELDTLKGLIAALPKVEGDFDVVARYRNENGSVHLNDEVKALLKHRQGMEG